MWGDREPGGPFGSLWRSWIWSSGQKPCCITFSLSPLVPGSEDKETGRQGDKEPDGPFGSLRRSWILSSGQKQSCIAFSLSPLLPISLSTLDYVTTTC